MDNPFKVMNRLPRRHASLLFLLCAIPALNCIFCGCARQVTLDRKIYKVSGPAGTNYYRVTIDSVAWNGKAYFKAGLYPAYAVDMFRGEEVELPTEMVDVEAQMRKAVIHAQTNALHDYLNADTHELRGEAARKLVAVQEMPISEGRGIAGTNRTVEMTFNPVRSLVDYTANKKFVIALSSDPDEILNQIGAFVEEAKTSETIQAAVTSQLQGSSIPTQLRVALLNSVIQTLKEQAGRDDVDSAEKLADVISKVNAALENAK
jgi:hypothetical protein